LDEEHDSRLGNGSNHEKIIYRSGSFVRAKDLGSGSLGEFFEIYT
jgi:hypothetical protein